MKKFKRGLIINISVAIAGIVLVYVLYNGFFLVKSMMNRSEDIFRVEGKELQIMQEGKWMPFEMKGVNIGTGYPGVFPNEYGISKETYLNWFEKIGEMNANSVRVYKLQSPDFYEALCEYNEKNEKKLYLVQGVDFDENLMVTNDNILDDNIKKKVFEHTYDTINAVHGNGTVYDNKTGDLLFYNDDVSDYLAGYILGIEWDELYVSYICELNDGIKPYKGKYLYSSKDATPFDVFLTEWGDCVFKYGEKKYEEQKLVSFCNWPETDPFVNEISMITGLKPENEKDTESFVDIEHIKTTSKVESGLFASYNVYPYFPFFLQMGKYTEYVDENGDVNAYRKYLMELTNYHSCPVVVAEYGIPTSRSKAYKETWRKMNHGGLNEDEQADILVKLYNDIKLSGCAGSIVFSWQDEWYKRTWNENTISDPDGRAFWNNAQSAEQSYGLLAFDPGKKGSCNYPDGDLSEWDKKDIVMKGEDTTLSIKSDEKYVYLMADGIDHSKNNNDFVRIALDIVPKAGAVHSNGVTFDRPVDFIINIAKEGNSLISVQEYADIFPYSIRTDNYHTKTREKIYSIFSSYSIPEAPRLSGENFVAVSRVYGSIEGFREHRMQVEAVGVLKRGNANPDKPGFDSNADYFVTDDAVEIRIPWQLLNFSNPARCKIVGDCRENGFSIEHKKIKALKAASYHEDTEKTVELGSYRLKGWEKPKFNERLKKSYYALQAEFEKEAESKKELEN